MIILKNYLFALVIRLKGIIKPEKKFFFTFTYYVPSPPKRGHGYQEKHFDRLIFHISKLKIKIMSIQTQNNQSKEHSGMWVICFLKGTKTQIDSINIWERSDELLEEAPLNVESSEEVNLETTNQVELPDYNDQNFLQEKIKGLYHIK